MGYSKVNAVSKEHGVVDFLPIVSNSKNVLTTRATGSFGTITVNEIETLNQKIWHSHFNIREDTHLNLNLQGEVPSLRFLFTLMENMNFQFREFGKGIRLRDQFNLLYNPDSDIQYFFRGGKEYAAVVIFLKHDWLLGWKKSLPEIQYLLENVQSKKPFLIVRPTTVQIRSLVNELLNNRNKREILIEAKVLELLDLVIEQIENAPRQSGVIKLNPLDIEKIEEARNHLQEHVSNPGTILELAEKINLNEFKLKRGFKQIVGFTIHDFLLQERMALAIKLLKNTTLDVKKIASIVGFKSYPYFIAAFKKRFGYSASSIRRPTGKLKPE